MEKARQYTAVIRSEPHRLRHDAFVQGGAGDHTPFFGAPCSPYLEAGLSIAPNIGETKPVRSKSESLLQHRAQFASEVFENKVFLSSVTLREVDIALSWGQGGKDHPKPCINAGRQIQCCKDLLLLRLRRSWRLLPFRAAKTARRCNSRRMRQHNRRSITASWFTSAHCFGRAFGPVHPALPICGGANG